VVSATDSYGCLSRPHEAECTPFQTRRFSENMEAPGFEHRTSGSVARNTDHWTTEAVGLLLAHHKSLIGVYKQTANKINKVERSHFEFCIVHYGVLPYPLETNKDPY
jgi:hypothetical protein